MSVASGFREWRRGWDSNPRETFPPLRDFQSRLFGHSSTSPNSIGRVAMPVPVEYESGLYHRTLELNNEDVHRVPLQGAGFGGSRSGTRGLRMEKYIKAAAP